MTNIRTPSCSDPGRACARRHALFADLGGREIGGLSYDDVWYNLMNVAFKAPAEHTFDGMRFGGARGEPGSVALP